MKGIGPDDSGHASEGSVESGNQPHQQNAGGERKSGGSGKSKGGCVDDGTEPAETAEDKEGGNAALSIRAKALLDELIGGGDLMPMIEGVKKFEDDRGDGETGEGDGDQSDIFLVGGGGEPDVGDGAREGGIHTHSDCEPGQVSSA
ncbi:MAG: hypothetical protein CMF29_04040 [Kiritimatiellaceae bacterium]|nr:hypothetical protein [Kiritimatiellaceae bacterium]